MTSHFLEVLLAAILDWVILGDPGATSWDDVALKVNFRAEISHRPD